MIAAHPFRGLAATRVANDNPLKLMDSIIERPIFRYVDDLEVLNGASGSWERKLGWAVARRLSMKGIGGSDAHGFTTVGACYTNFESDIRNEEDFLTELRAGRYKAANNLIFR